MSQAEGLSGAEIARAIEAAREAFPLAQEVWFRRAATWLEIESLRRSFAALPKPERVKFLGTLALAEALDPACYGDQVRSTEGNIVLLEALAIFEGPRPASGPRSYLPEQVRAALERLTDDSADDPSDAIKALRWRIVGYPGKGWRA